MFVAHGDLTQGSDYLQTIGMQDSATQGWQSNHEADIVHGTGVNVGLKLHSRFLCFFAWSDHTQCAVWLHTAGTQDRATNC